MKTFLLGLVVYFSQICHGQLKDCFYMDGGSASVQFPCDPGANVSACCAMGWRCSSSLQCINGGVGIIPGCTDRSFADNACPFPLIDSEHPAVNTQPWSYANNVTICQDGTVCPFTSNYDCCSLGAGKKEILFHYNDAVPSAVGDLSYFYARAGFSLPSSTTSSSSATFFTSQTSSTTSSSSATFFTSQTSIESSSNGVSASIASASRTGTSSNQLTLTVTSTPNSAASRLSSPAKVGIGVGLALGISLLVGLAIILLRRHRKSNTSLDPPALPQSRHWPAKAGELGGKSALAEMNGLGPKRGEMDGRSTPAELESSRG